MIRNAFTSFFLLALSIVTIFPHIAASAGTTEGKWSYTVKNGIEQSVRTYLLVYEPGTHKERRVTVVSRCEKPHRAEGTYGKCSHNVTVQPMNGDFTLTTGEDVAMIRKFAEDAPLILATIEYGCCAGPDTVRFYTEKGQYLGAIERYGVSEKANYKNLIARTFDMGNGTSYGNKTYLLVQAENKEKSFQALVFEKGMKPKRIPVVLTVPAREKCEDWHIEELEAYGDRQDITLKLTGVWCPNTEGAQERFFSCSASEKAITCLPREVKKTRGVGDPSTKGEGAK
jgi:hypothetical protein